MERLEAAGVSAGEQSGGPTSVGTERPGRRIVAGLRREPNGQRRVSWMLALPAVALLFAFHFVPAVAGGYYAFTSWTGIGPAHWVGLSNFKLIFEAGETRDALFHTLELSASFVVFANLIGLGLALSLNNAIRTRHLLRTLFFLPAVISPVAVAVIWQFIFTSNGALNQVLQAVGLSSFVHPWLGDPTYALWTVVLVLVWQFSGLTMIIYLAGLQAVSPELYEAATVDGASQLRQLRRITLPLLAPAITVSLTMTLVFGLRVFDQVLALTGGGPVNASQTLATEIYERTFVFGQFGYGAAIAVVLTALIAVMVIMQLTVLRRREANL
jgi:raffinose/stachyose/melibiose transport system permease protein